MGLSCTVLGGTGYGGGELLRLLAQHPALTVAAVGARRELAGPAGTASALHKAVPLDEALAVEADVCFSALPEGTLEAGSVAARLVVDLAGDHRHETGWAYGLTEFARAELGGAERIANPGCYPTATLLAVVPLLRAGVVSGPVVVDALSGASGAGRKQEEHLLFSELAGGAAAYGTVEHRHVAEMERGMAGFTSVETVVSFTPHLVPMARGLLVTARLQPTRTLSDADLLDVLGSAYSDEPLIHVSDAWPKTKAVAGTNRAVVHARLDARAGFVIASCAIDNLGKGAAGQAVQNANVALGIEETAGLEGYALWP